MDIFIGVVVVSAIIIGIGLLQGYCQNEATKAMNLLYAELTDFPTEESLLRYLDGGGVAKMIELDYPDDPPIMLKRVDGEYLSKSNITGNWFRFDPPELGIWVKEDTILDLEKLVGE